MGTTWKSTRAQRQSCTLVWCMVPGLDNRILLFMTTGQLLNGRLMELMDKQDSILNIDDISLLKMVGKAFIYLHIFLIYILEIPWTYFLRLLSLQYFKLIFRSRGGWKNKKNEKDKNTGFVRKSQVTISVLKVHIYYYSTLFSIFSITFEPLVRFWCFHLGFIKALDI